jgi:hypothetical protein
VDRFQSMRISVNVASDGGYASAAWRLNFSVPVVSRGAQPAGSHDPISAELLYNSVVERCSWTATLGCNRCAAPLHVGVIT